MIHLLGSIIRTLAQVGMRVYPTTDIIYLLYVGAKLELAGHSVKNNNMILF